MIRYSPDAMKRIREYEADLKRRVSEGKLGNDEALTLLRERVRTEADGPPPRKVKCANCGAVHNLVGVGQTFVCACSEKPQSVWDCRLQ